MGHWSNSRPQLGSVPRHHSQALPGWVRPTFGSAIALPRSPRSETLRTHGAFHCRQWRGRELEQRASGSCCSQPSVGDQTLGSEVAIPQRIHLAVASMSHGSRSSRPSRTTWPPPHDDEASGTWSAGCRRPALLCRPHDLGCFRSSLFGGATEAVLSPLWRDTSNSLSDLAPAGARSPARRGRFLTQPIRGASELIGKSQRGESCLESDGHARDDVVSATFDELRDQRLQFRVHVPRLPMSGFAFNYVLTTIC